MHLPQPAEKGMEGSMQVHACKRCLLPDLITQLTESPPAVTGRQISNAVQVRPWYYKIYGGLDDDRTG